MNNPYIKNGTLALQDSLNYRVGFIIRFLSSFTFDYVKVAIWYAVMMAYKERLAPSIILNTVQYMILASAVSSFFVSFSTTEITSRVMEGTIERDLVYPVNLIFTLFSREIGKMIGILISNVLPTFILLTIIYSPIWEFSLIKFVGLIILLFLGICIQFLVIIQVDILSFWLKETYSIQRIRDASFKFLSGLLVPLWYYPEWLLKVLNCLPFKNIIYNPVAFYVNRISNAHLLNEVLSSTMWILIFSVTVFITWKSGIKKLEIHGG